MITLMNEKGKNEAVTLQYLYSGFFHSEARWIHSERIMDSYEIICVKEGEVFLQEEDIQFHLAAGEVMLLDAGKRHKGYAYSEEEVSFYWLHFRFQGAASYQPEFKTFSLKGTSGEYEIYGLFRRLLYVANVQEFSAASPELMVALIIDYLKVAYKASFLKNEKLLCEIAEWIRIHSDRKLTAEEVAEKFEYNSDYLSVIFKEKYEVGLKKYINLQRINYAKELLATSTLSIKEIAANMSFDTANLFVNYFKYHENLSPSKYRNLYFGVHFNNR